MTKSRKKRLREPTEDIYLVQDRRRAKLSHHDHDKKPHYTYRKLASQPKLAETSVEPTSSVPSEPIVVENPGVSETEKATESRITKQLKEYMTAKSVVRRGVIAHEYDDRLFQDCACQRGAKADTTCRECRHYRPTCAACFAATHRSNPLHWAYQWSEGNRCLVRHDISAIDKDFAHIVGHRGELCPFASEPYLFTITSCNGIHGTRLRFCECVGGPTHLEQLLDARMCPSTIKDPKSAFDFDVLKLHDLLLMKCHASTISYIEVLRRLTDGAFTFDVPDTYENLNVVSRVWELVTVEKRTGQAHGIDKHVPHRPAGSLKVLCPCCVEPFVNLPSDWHKTPPEHMHIYMIYLALDGNNKSNHLINHCNPGDFSIWDGKGYFPPAKEYADYLRAFGHLVDEEPELCKHLTVVKNQNLSKKHGNVDTKGVVNGQCPHIYVGSTVDMHKSESFVHADAALIHQHRSRGWIHAPCVVDDPDSPCGAPGHRCKKTPDVMGSYDNGCSVCVNFLARMRERFPDEAELLEALEWIVPSLHVKGHKFECEHIHGGAYIPRASDLNFENIEYYWPILNHFAPSSRQMSPGHRQDAICRHNDLWNAQKRQTQMARTEKELLRQWVKFFETRAFFRDLCLAYGRDKILRWNQVDARAKLVHGVLHSPYAHKHNKVPSLDSLFKHLQELERMASERNGGSGRKESSEAVYIKEGIEVEELQRALRVIVSNAKRDGTTDGEITKRREKLVARIDRLHALQFALAIEAFSAFLENETIKEREDTPAHPEHQTLHLPSDFSATDRQRLGLVRLAQHETEFRQGEVNDCLTNLRTTCQILSGMVLRVKKNPEGYDGKTRTWHKRRSTEQTRDGYVARYNASREKMIALNFFDKDDPNPPVPKLTINDTYRNPTEARRRLGEAKRLDGYLWRMTGGVSVLKSQEDLAKFEYSLALEDGGTSEFQELAGTRMSRRARPQRPVNRTKPSQSNKANDQATETDDDDMYQELRVKGKKKDDRKDGWIWDGSGPAAQSKKMSEKEMLEWREESNSVAWHRAKASVWRAREGYERIHEEMRRCITSFRFEETIWTKMADEQSDPAYEAFARRQVSMFHRMVKEGEYRYGRCVNETLDDRNSKRAMWERLVDFQEKEMGWFGVFLKEVTAVEDEGDGDSGSDC